MIILRPIDPAPAVEVTLRLALEKIVRGLLASAREALVPVVTQERDTYHRDPMRLDALVGESAGFALAIRDDAGSNARTMIEALRAEAARLEAQAAQAARDAGKREAARHTEKWTATVRSSAQIDIRALLADDDLAGFLSLWSERMNALITNLSTDVLHRIERETLGAILENRSNESIAESLRDIDGIGRNRSRLIARDQASKLNGGMNEFRQRQAGITHYKWRTLMDGRERPTHHANNGQIFAWDKPSTVTGHPSHDINCRCRAMAIITDDPEDLDDLVDDPADLSDFFSLNLPLIRTVSPTISQPVMGFTDAQLVERLDQVRTLRANITAAAKVGGIDNADASRLLVEVFGFKPSDVDIEALLGRNLKTLFATERAKYLAAVQSRLELIERQLEHARVAPRPTPIASPAKPPQPPVTPAAAAPAPKLTPAPSLPSGAYSERLAGTAKPLAEAVAEGRAFVAAEGKRTGNEWAFVHDIDGRSFARISSGAKNFVEINPSLVPELYTPGHRVVFHHNHPGSSSFSRADLRAFAGLPGLDTLYAHGANGSSYELRVPKGRTFIKARTDRAMQETGRAVGALVQGGKMSAKDADRIINHIALLAMERKGWIEYRFTLAGDTAATAKNYAKDIELVVNYLVRQI